METVAPIEVVMQQVKHSERIAKALAIIEQRPRYGALQISMWFSIATLCFLGFMSFMYPTSNVLLFLISVLITVIASVTGNAITAQRRLEALIVLVKSEIEK